jgi:hypothetical protein
LILAYASAVPQSKSKRSRYTPPPPKKAPPSKLWVPVSAVSLLAAGLSIVVTNYLNLLPGANTENRYLLLGIALISSGFLFLTGWR